jgi:hypothetical protein
MSKKLELSNGVPRLRSELGAKNYIDSDSSKFERTVGSWETDNGAGSASGSLTLSRETSAPLSGAGSLKVVKSAVNATGHFSKLTTKAIDLIDRGKALYGSFSFDATDANFNASDVVVEIYDLTNSAVLYSGLSTSLEILGSKGTFNYVTYTETTTASIQVRLKINSTNATAYTLYFDEFELGTKASVQIPIITEWQSFTPTGGFTSTTYTGQWRRVGDSAEIQVKGVLTGTPGAATMTVDMPSGLLIDTAKIAGTTGSTNALGVIYGVEVGVARRAGVVRYSSTTNVIFANDGNINTWSQAVPHTWGNTDEFAVMFTAPISGWGIGASTKDNELNLQTIKASMYLSTNQTISSTATTIVDFDSTDIDTHNIFDSAQKGFVIPKSDYYTVLSDVELASITVDERVTVAIRVNGSNRLIRLARGGVTDTTTSFNRILYLNKDDIVTLVVASTSDTSYLVRGSSVYTHLSIVSAPDYTVLGVVETGAKYVEAKTTTNHAAAGTANDTWYTPTTAFKITLTEGTWDIDSVIYTNLITSAGVVVSQCAIATSATPGTGQLENSIGSSGFDGAAINRKASHSLKYGNYTVAAGTTQDIYVHLRSLSLGGGVTVTQLDLGSYFGTNSILMARKVPGS